MIFISSAAATIFFPARFFTSNITTCLPSFLANVVLSFSLKLTVATSFKYIEFPFSDLITKFFKSDGLSISPKILIVLLCPLAIKLPAEEVTFPFWIAPTISLKLTCIAIIL